MAISNRVAILFLACLATGAFGEDLYIDQNATGGANNGLSWSSAWTNIASISWGSGAGKVSRGDTFWWSGGTTSQTWTASGPNSMILDLSNNTETGTNRITMRVGQDSTNSGFVYFDGGCPYPPTNGERTIYLVKLQSHLTINGEVNGSNRFVFCNSYSNATFVLSELKTYPDGHDAAGMMLNEKQGVEIYHCIFSNLCTGIDCKGTTSSNLIFGWNDFKKIHQEAAINLQLSDAVPETAWDTFKVFSNKVELCIDSVYTVLPRLNNGPDGIQTGNGVSIFYNTFTCLPVNWRPSGQHCDMVQGITSSNKLNLKVHGNIFTNAGDSMIDFGVNRGFLTGDLYPATDVLIYNNLFLWHNRIGPYNPTIRSYREGGFQYFSNIVIVNNLVADNDCIDRPVFSFIDDINGSSVGSNNIVANNLIINCGSNSANSLTYRFGNEEGPGKGQVRSIWTVSNNLIWLSNFNWTRIMHYGTNYTVPNWKITNELTLVTNLPSFRSYTFKSLTNNYRIWGTDTNIRDRGISFSHLFTNDFDGKTRSGTWDIGPFEFDDSLKLWYTFADDFTNNGYVQDYSGNAAIAHIMMTNMPGQIAGPTNIGGYGWLGVTNGSVMVNDPPNVYHIAPYAAITNLGALAKMTNGTFALWVRWATNAERHDTLLDCGFPISDLGGDKSKTTNCWTWQHGYYNTTFSSTTANFKVFYDDVEQDSNSTNGIIAVWTNHIRDSVTWYHLALTFSADSDVCVPYLNGISYVTNEFVYPYLKVQASETIPWITLGAYQHAGTHWFTNDMETDGQPNAGFFKGTMADLRIYNRALNPDEIQAIYLGSETSGGGGAGGDEEQPPATNVIQKAVLRGNQTWRGNVRIQ